MWYYVCPVYNGDREVGVYTPEVSGDSSSFSLSSMCGFCFSSFLLLLKGIGKIHAKWSPVATASYKFEPHITFQEDLLAQAPASVKLQM